MSVVPQLPEEPAMVHLVLDADIFLAMQPQQRRHSSPRKFLTSLGVLQETLMSSYKRLSSFFCRTEQNGAYAIDGRIGELSTLEAQRLRVAHDNWAVVGWLRESSSFAPNEYMASK